jgi:multiple sugar transport system ATP-binding protein
MNLVPVSLAEGGVVIAGQAVPLQRSTVAALVEEGARSATLGFRPEAVEFVAPGQGFPVEVQVVEELGSDAFAYGRLREDGAPAAALDDAAAEVTGRLLVLRADARRPPAKGEIVHVAIRPGEAHVFSARTGARISDAGS